jgi:YHS domain-containing protein
MTVTAESPHRHEHEGSTYFFCSEKCRVKFAAEPARYVAPKTEAPSATEAGAVYVCPMHPEIERAHDVWMRPGNAGPKGREASDGLMKFGEVAQRVRIPPS